MKKFKISEARGLRMARKTKHFNLCRYVFSADCEFVVVVNLFEYSSAKT